MGRRCVLVFSKQPRPGRVKTRLVGALTEEQAAELHAAFLTDTVDRLRDGPFELRMAWALERGEQLHLTGFPEPHLRQQGDDLGQRLHHGLAWAAESCSQVAAVGSDCPHIPQTAIEAAFEALERGAEVVLGPAKDGGFYLIALRRESIREQLFLDIPWSSGRELDSIVRRCRRLGLALAEVEQVADIDEPEDLERLVIALRRGEVRCPATERLLSSWGRLT